MKRLNYYQVHKNKKPRKKKVTHRFNYFKVMLLMTSAISAAQRINSVTSKAQKALAIAGHCINHAISNIAK